MEIIKGRPPKASNKRKRFQYSVWVSAEEKVQIDTLVKASNLPASQFFLSMVLGKKVNYPKVKQLPEDVKPFLIELKKLSGLLALSALKTKDKPMLAEKWQQSAMKIRWIADLLTRFVFMELDMPQFGHHLKIIDEKTKMLYIVISMLKNSLEKDEMSSIVAQINQSTQQVINIFGKQFYVSATSEEEKIIWEPDVDVHEEIGKILTSIINDR